MRLLLVHADRFSYAVTGKADVKGFTHDPDAAEPGTLTEVLVVFMAVESADGSAPEDVAGQAAALVVDTVSKVGATAAIVYPYAHLSSDLAAPQVATAVLDSVRDGISSRRPQLRVEAAPFGYYKSFELECKGHPLSELSRTIRSSGTQAAPESAALTAEKTLRSEWRIYRADGSYESAADYTFGRPEDAFLADLLTYELEGTRAAEDAPPHIRLMRDHELVDYEPASDAGNLRWYPQGILVKRLLEQHVTGMVTAYGGMEVETPLMYDYAHPALAKYLQRFPARQYVVKSDDRDFFLRFAACFGQYMIMHDLVASYRDLPVRLYELTHHSFRREQGGEVAGLRRLRAFTMPDMHSMVADNDMAKEEFLNQVELCLRWVRDIGVECVSAVRFVRSFIDANPGFIEQLMRILDRPALVEIWNERFFYFVAKFELNFIDNARKAACLSTVQIDVENGERFDIRYVDSDGSQHHPLLLHTSISGSVDRNVYAILEHQARTMAQGQKAEWPVWLAPVQVRLIPVSDSHADSAVELAERLTFRVDVDDRDLKLGKKIREAEKDWVPYTIVIGDRELSGDGPLQIRPRSGEQFGATVDELIARLKKETAGRPSRPLNSPIRLSRRPVFVG